MTTEVRSGPASLFAGLVLTQALARNWWLLLLRGVAAIAFAVLAFGWPGLTLLTLTLVWGAYALIDGALALWWAISGKAGPIAPRWWLGVVGVVGILAGILAFSQPALVAGALLLYIALWAIVLGLLQIWGGFKVRKEVKGEWLLILGGVVLVAFGAVMLARPGVGALTVIWMIGIFELVAGFSFIAAAFRLRKIKHAGGQAASEPI